MYELWKTSAHSKCHGVYVIWRYNPGPLRCAGYFRVETSMVGCHVTNRQAVMSGHRRSAVWLLGSASLARSIRFHFRHRTGRIRSVSDHRAGRVWRSRHRSKTPNCLPGARDQVPALFRNAIERRGASVDSNSGAPITQSTFNMLRRMANLLSLLNWWLHRYDNEDDYALFQV